MKNKILKLISNTNDLSLTAFKNRIPEIIGDCDFHFPAKGIENTNILLISGVNKEFISVLNELITTEVLTFEPCSFFVVNSDGGEVYDVPIVQSQKMSYKTLHWLPLLMKKGKNFKQTLTAN